MQEKALTLSECSLLTRKPFTEYDRDVIAVYR